MLPTLVFDIETIPDVQGYRLLQQLPDYLSDEEVANIAFHQRRQSTGGEFLQHHLQKVCAISCALREGAQFRVWSLGDIQADESEIIQRFFDGIEKYIPNLVSWNGSGFDLPVLHYRAMIHGIQAPKYWDMGDDDRDFKYNNYLSRYHTRHLDLMDILALYTGRANAPLDDLAKLCGFAGKLGMDGSKVWSAYSQGQLQSIRDYCETDVANTYLMFLRFQKMRGHLSPQAYEEELSLVRTTLTSYSGEHWKQYLLAWKS